MKTTGQLEQDAERIKSLLGYATACMSEAAKLIKEFNNESSVRPAISLKDLVCSLHGLIIIVYGFINNNK